MTKILRQIAPAILCVATMALAWSPTALAVNVDSLLALTIGGRPALDSARTLRSYVVHGRATLNGLEGSFTGCFVAPDKTYLDLETTLFTLVQAYDGRIAWQQDHAGQITEIRGMERSELMNGLYFDSFSHLLPDRMEGGRRYVGLEAVDDRPCHRIDFYPLYHDTISLFIDRASGQTVLMRQTLDELPSETRYSDFRLVGGILWPFRTTMKTIGAPLQIEFEYREILVNQPVDPALFLMKRTEATNFNFPVEADSTVVPVKYIDGHLYAEVRLGQRRVWMILDSGASASMLDRQLTGDLGLEPRGSLPAKGMSGYETIDLIRLDTLAVGDLTLYGVTVGSVDLSNLAGGLESGLEFGGILGYDFLSSFPILIDYQRPQITIYRPESFHPAVGGAEIPFHLTLQVPTVRANLAGVPGDFIVDLGNPFGLLVHYPFVEQNRLDTLLHDVEPLGMTVGGIGGQVGGRTAMASTFSLGEVLLSSIRVILMDSEAGLAGSTELAGNVGNLIWEGFQVLFDYRSSRMILYPAGSADEARP
ncbi:MAG: aspartyl protease family protein [bacterium]